MSFAWMRRIDGWIGRPLAAALRLFTRAPASLYGDADAAPPRRVICAKFIGLGSVVLLLPLLRALKDQGARVAFWSFEGQADLVRLSGLADEIFIIKPTFGGLLPSIVKSLFQAWRFRADAFFDLEPASYLSAILGRLSRAKARIGFLAGKPPREALFTHLVSLSPERHLMESHLWMARRLGVAVPEKADFPALGSLAHIRNVLPAFPGRRRIVVNINPSDLSAQRLWPEDSWVALCNELLEDYQVDLVFPGLAEERGQVQSVVARLKAPPRVFNIAGETQFVELLKVLSEAALVISVDNGGLQLAAWTGTPLVALFGPETPRLLAPRSPRAVTVWAGLPCSPCLGGSRQFTSCRDNQCMKRITPEQVLAIARRILSEPARPARAAS